MENRDLPQVFKKFINEKGIKHAGDLLDTPLSVIIADKAVGEVISIIDNRKQLQKVLIEKSLGWHKKLGNCLVLDEATIILPIHSKRQKNHLLQKTKIAPPLIFETKLSRTGAGILVTTPIFEDTPHPSAICNAPNPFFEALSDSTLTLIYHDQIKLVSAYRYYLKRKQGLVQELKKLCNHILDHMREKGVNEYLTFNANIPTVYLFYTLNRVASKINYKLSASEELTASWACSWENLSEEYSVLDEKIKNLEVEDALKFLSGKFSPTIKKFFEKVLELKSYTSQEYHNLVLRLITSEIVPELARIISFCTVSNEQNNKHEDISIVLDILLQVFMWSEEQTKNGMRLPWLTEYGEVKYINLDLEKIIDRSSYWDDILMITHDRPSFNNNGPLFEIGNLISPNDRPIYPYAEAIDDKDYDIFPLVENIEEAYLEIQSYLDEAACAKQWTIPPGAIVQLNNELFPYLELYETPNFVYGILRDQNDLFLPFSVSPERGEINIRCYPWLYKPSGAPALEAFDSYDDFAENARAAISLIICAIIRDFWVVEHRERVFRYRFQKRSSKISKRHDKLMIVYLPRIEYFHEERQNKTEKSNEAKLKRAHEVRAHLRKSSSASITQRALARRYGFIIPSGHTFVRPHRRGQERLQVIYRSRSALNALYTKIEDSEKLKPLWFQFEADVRDLLRNLGFKTEHISASRSGDDGIDIFAEKREHGNIESWIVQCKCYSPIYPINKNIVRELIGTMTSERANIETQGMIVTTSTFRSGAIKLAEKHGIQLIDGEQFQSMLLKFRNETNSL